jgi:hypothetical protein
VPIGVGRRHLHGHRVDGAFGFVTERRPEAGGCGPIVDLIMNEKRRMALATSRS